jgi:hypothetical protein
VKERRNERREEMEKAPVAGTVFGFGACCEAGAKEERASGRVFWQGLQLDCAEGNYLRVNAGKTQLAVA